MARRRDEAEEVDSFLAIDEHQLDKEWVQQPRLYFKYARRLAEAHLAQDDAKSTLDLTFAELDLQIRSAPARFNIKKVSEAAIKQAIMGQPDYVAEQKAWAKAKHRCAIIQAAVTALDHRKKALEKLVDLHGQNYFSAPRATGEGREAMAQAEKKAVRAKGIKQRN